MLTASSTTINMLSVKFQVFQILLVFSSFVLTEFDVLLIIICSRCASTRAGRDPNFLLRAPMIGFHDLKMKFHGRHASSALNELDFSETHNGIR